MRFDLRLTNPRRARWLLWGWLAYLPIILLLVSVHLGQLIPVYCLAVIIPTVFYNWLLRQPAWVLVAADGIAWANPADSEPVRCSFAELRAYRFDMGKNAEILTLYLRNGSKTTLSGRLHQEFQMMVQAFRREIHQYNAANPDAAVAWEPSGLTKFFTSPLATRVLWGLLALAAAWLGWGLAHDWPGIAYLPLLLLGLPYLVVWANFYYERR